jgi:cytochrome c biogenesis protein CcdA
MMNSHRRRSGKQGFFIVYALFALYLVNMGLGFVKMPNFLLKVEQWIILISGILLFLGGLRFLGIGRRHHM